jgi:hypothetical protein
MALSIGGATPKEGSSSENSPSIGGATAKNSSNSPLAGNAPKFGGVTGTSK